ncbi:LAFA_0B03422g1_1 [Lachancea sp. 'fantastica']|nr:LAFA_0B03422g1_1 [Lachancea sp. 'fantastica']
MSQQLQERFSQGPQEDPDSSLPLDPTAINSTGLDDTPLPDPTEVSARPRRAQVKLTAEKLLSPKGLPKIMKEAPKKIRFSKRRSSYENLTQFLQFYQLWANDLFPKAKFRDFVTISRTLGKTDRELREYRIELVRQELGFSSVGEPELETESLGETVLPPNGNQNMPPSEPPSPQRQTVSVPENSRDPAIDSASDDDMIYDRSRIGESQTTETTGIAQKQLPKVRQELNSSGIPEIQDETEFPPELLDPTATLTQASQAANKIRQDDENQDEDEMDLMREFGM